LLLIMAGIYLHIPFCKQACHYCDFHFSTNLNNAQLMVESMIRELSLQQSYLEKDEIETIYFGGGTPSILGEDLFKELYHAVQVNFTIKDQAEITVEANPDDLSNQKISFLKSVGVNRLSIGVQSLNDEVLRYLNRPHSSADAHRSVVAAREAGFDNISLDLIYAIPMQPDDVWFQNIMQAISLAPEHISSYSLTIEDKTAFGNWFKKGRLKPASEEATAHQLEMLVSSLADAGYQQYEVSNFCKPGFESKHNSSYWKRSKYLGIGPAAHSYNGISRQYNISNNLEYIKSLANGLIPCEKEILTRENQANEYLLTRLRTSWGVDLTYLKGYLNYDVLQQHNDYVKMLLENRMAVVENETLKLTQKGKLVADKIASDLFL
jgi:oxygen-independent coproporphyrinogen III oxidase